MTIVQSGLFKSGPYGINECLLGNMNSLYGFNSTYDLYAAFYGTNESLLGKKFQKMK